MNVTRALIALNTKSAEQRAQLEALRASLAELCGLPYVPPPPVSPPPRPLGAWKDAQPDGLAKTLRDFSKS